VAACGLSVAATGDGASDGAVTDAVRDSAPDAATDTSRPSCFAAPSMIGWWSGDVDMSDRVGGRAGVSGTQSSASSVRFGPGKVASAFDLRGESYVQIPNATALQIDATVTMEAWIFATALGGRIVDKITAGGSDGYMLDTHQSKLRMIVGGTSVSSTATLPTGVWTHVAGTYDGATEAVFIDGVLAGSKPRTGPIPTTTLAVRIGADSSGKSRFAGLIDEVILYDRALGAQELAAIASGLARCMR